MQPLDAFIALFTALCFVVLAWAFSLRRNAGERHHERAGRNGEQVAEEAETGKAKKTGVVGRVITLGVVAVVALLVTYSATPRSFVDTVAHFDIRSSLPVLNLGQSVAYAQPSEHSAEECSRNASEQSNVAVEKGRNC